MTEGKRQRRTRIAATQLARQIVTIKLRQTITEVKTALIAATCRVMLPELTASRACRARSPSSWLPISSGRLRDKASLMELRHHSTMGFWVIRHKSETTFLNPKYPATRTPVMTDQVRARGRPGRERASVSFPTDTVCRLGTRDATRPRIKAGRTKRQDDLNATRTHQAQEERTVRIRFIYAIPSFLHGATVKASEFLIRISFIHHDSPDGI